jgi:hypothetical protein
VGVVGWASRWAARLGVPPSILGAPSPSTPALHRPYLLPKPWREPAAARVCIPVQACAHALTEQRRRASFVILRRSRASATLSPPAQPTPKPPCTHKQHTTTTHHQSTHTHATHTQPHTAATAPLHSAARVVQAWRRVAAGGCAVAAEQPRCAQQRVDCLLAGVRHHHAAVCTAARGDGRNPAGQLAAARDACHQHTQRSAARGTRAHRAHLPTSRRGRHCAHSEAQACCFRPAAVASPACWHRPCLLAPSFSPLSFPPLSYISSRSLSVSSGLSSTGLIVRLARVRCLHACTGTKHSSTSLQSQLHSKSQH